MDCPVCFERFDGTTRRPKLLPCGHTLCLGCVHAAQALPGPSRCPECHQMWAQPAGALQDNFSLLKVVQTDPTARPAAALWCVDCRAPSSARCLDEHDVRNPKGVLRQCLQDVVPRARQQLDSLENSLQDGAALTALRLLRGAPSTCRISLRQDDEETFGAEVEVRVEEDSLLQALVVSLAASGRLFQAAAEVLPAPENIEELDLDDLSKATGRQRRKEKAATLERIRQRGVWRMTDVWCNYDPAWALKVLLSAAPTVEELSLANAREEHLLAVHAMPGLRRMELDAADTLAACPPVLPALPRGSLQCVRVERLPLPTMQSLLRAHSATLDVVELGVSTPGGGPWPWGCDDLEVLLGQCGLRVSRLVLLRMWPCSHSDTACLAQVAAVRRVLPAANVQCHLCDDVELEDY